MNDKSQNALRLFWAMLLSLAFHASLIFAAQRWFVLVPPLPLLPPVISARLERPAQEEAEESVLKNTLKEDPGTPAEAKPPRRPGRDPNTVPRPSAKPAQEQIPEAASVEMLYPPEALALGLEGEPVLWVEVDANSRIVSVGIGASSGHPILDEAAVKQLWQLGKLEGHRSKTLLFPVKFKLQ